jgi:uroporphyrinogen-III synthase/uroporphyrinogen III methyltransferase/synthase
MPAKRVLVTRAAHQAGKLSDALRAAGFEPVEVPVLEIQPPLDSKPLNAALQKIDTYDWLILTSANTVRAIAWSGVQDKISHLKVAAVGEATAEEARKVGLTVAIVPEKYVADSLVDELLQQSGFWHNIRPSSDEGALKGYELSRANAGTKENGILAPDEGYRGQKILLARAETARDVIPDALRAAGAMVDVVDAYRNVMPETAPAMLRAALEQGIDAATFTSSSSVTHLADAARTAGIAFPFATVKAISIGPITSATLREHGWEPAAEADPSDVEGLVEAVTNSLTR